MLVSDVITILVVIFILIPLLLFFVVEAIKAVQGYILISISMLIFALIMVMIGIYFISYCKKNNMNVECAEYAGVLGVALIIAALISAGVGIFGLLGV